MKKIFLNMIMAVVCCAGLLFTGCSSEDDPFVLRSTDGIDFGYASSSQSFTVCTNGDWSVAGVDESGEPVDWIVLSPAEGRGDGSTREVVTVKVNRNSSSARKGIVKLYAAGQALDIFITQEEGTLIFGKSYLSGSLTKGKDLENVEIVLPYSRGTIGENFGVSIQLSGAATDGVQVADTQVTLKEEEGEIRIPVTGHPTQEGIVMFTISSTHPAGASLGTLEGKVEESTNDDPIGTVYYKEAFNLMIWGGDYIAQKEGIRPAKMSNDIEPDAETTTCTIGTDGSNSLVGSMSAKYVAARGFTGWTGSRIYERPGYIKIGVTATAGWAITPPLSAIQGKVNVKVSFDCANWDGASSKIVVTAENAGAVRVSEVSGLKFNEWTTFSVEIEGVKANTCIKFASPEGVTNGRFFLDNIKVEKIN